MTYIISLFLFFQASSFSLEPPKTPKQLFAEAAAYLEKEEYVQAIELYSLVSPNDTAFIEAQSMLINAYNNSEDYQKAIELGEKIKNEMSEFRKSIYINLANAYLAIGEKEKSILVFNEALELFPYNYLLEYNKGIALYRLQQYDQAIQSFINSASVNPFYSRSHYMLGYISMLQGHRTKALLSLYLHLAISANNDALVLCENLVKDALRDEGTIASDSIRNLFLSFDNLIKSKAAISDKFKQNIDFNAAIVKQTELLFSKLKYQEQSDDFWMDYYVPMYVAMEESGVSQAFIYFLLSSTKNEGVQSWLEKHDKEKSTWIDIANKHLDTYRTSAYKFINDEPFAFKRWYYSNNLLSAIGNKDEEGNYVGPWTFFYENNQVSSKGSYNESGNKIGNWNYYHENGVMSRLEEYDQNGELNGQAAKYFDDQGNLSIIPTHVKNQLTGPVQYFYPCGQMKSSYMYENGDPNGPAIEYHSSGSVLSEYTLSKGLKNGEFKSFYELGVLKEHLTYVDDEPHGNYRSYHNNGKPFEKGQYREGQLDGDWIGYFSNGNLQFKGTFAQDKRLGRWENYHRNGQPESISLYNDEGELHGISQYFNQNGTPSYDETYENGNLIAYTHYLWNGDSVESEPEENGQLLLKTYYSDGTLRTESKIIDGKIDGPFTEYYQSGVVKTEANYKDGMIHGSYKEYFPDGNLSIDCSYKKDLLDGLYTSYYNNKQVNKTGLYVNGQPELEWLDYYPDGTASAISYFVNGQLHGWNRLIAKNGKVHKSIKNNFGTPEILVSYDSLGLAYRSDTLHGGSGFMGHVTIGGDTVRQSIYQCGEQFKETELFPNGSKSVTYEIKNGLYHGITRGFNPDGSLVIDGRFKNNLRDSSWLYYHHNGQISTKYFYDESLSEDEIVSYYYNGQISVQSPYSMDNLTGPRKYFDQRGNLQTIKFYDPVDGFIYYIDSKSGDTIYFDSKGEFTLKSYFPNGKLAIEQQFKNGKYHGKCSYYNIDGTLIDETEYQNGDLHGKSTEYYANGSPYIEEYYQLDERSGKRKIFSETGQLIRSTSYEFGKQYGYDIYYNPDGSVAYKFYFWNDLLY